MKRFFVILPLVVFLLTLISGCSFQTPVEEGKYVCSTPYITFTYGKPELIDEIEIDRTVYKCRKIGGGRSNPYITYYKYQSDFPIERFPTDDMILAKFEFDFDTKTKQLTLFDRESRNVYHLDKIE